MLLLPNGMHPLNVSYFSEVSWDKIIVNTLLLRAFILIKRVRHVVIGQFSVMIT